jgi:glycosyltransferase involved in cell wall biosynthesis/GT2 family glycosyltransferase
MIDPQHPDYTNTPVSPQRPCFAYAPHDPAALPGVTIITPFYNTGPVFQETARSVLQQSLQQWEWLIVNDGSTEPGSLALLDSYRQRDPRIRVIDHPTNRGLSAARNTGFGAARTAYVVQLDSDDLLEPTAIEKWYWFLESYPEYAFVSGYSIGFGGKEYLWPHGFHDGPASLDANQIDNKSMIRTAVHQRAGGYDETIREGGEDWDFWLRCASLGHWGGTVPEYHAWYRCRATQSDRWANLEADRWQTFREQLRQRYPSLWQGAFPTVQVRWHLENDPVPDILPCTNRLYKDKPRLLLIVPWLTIGGADKFNLDVLGQLTRLGWEVCVATTLEGDHTWLPQFAHITPDIFILHHFLRLVDYPRFLRYLIHSRQIDVVMISHSELGYLLLPYLRAHCPGVTFTDFCHAEHENWKNGGYPRMGVTYQEMLDRNFVASEHLRQWMVRQQADPQRIRVCYINIDAHLWCPDVQRRHLVRQELGVDTTLPMILVVTRLSADKAPAVLAYTARQLARKASQFVLYIVGDGAEFAWVQAFIEHHRLTEHVRLLGAVPNERVRELLTAADIFFLPSQWEGIALSIYEAMACGLPVVGTDVGGQRELVTPECGVLLARSDAETEAEQYAEVLVKLLEHPQHRQALGQAGRLRVSTHFSLEQMGERLAALLQEARQAHGTHPQPVPSPGLGLACAAQAVEYTRLYAGAKVLWGTGEQVRLQQERYQELEAWLQTIQQTVGWRTLERLRHLRDGLLPRNSRRWRLYEQCRHRLAFWLRA